MIVGGNLIREARQRAGLSQAQLAERVGTSQPAVARWEGGGAQPPMERVIEVLRACGLDLQIRLVPHDTHDVGLAAANLRATPTERVRLLVSMERFSSKLRRIGAAARGEAVREAGPAAFQPEEVLAVLAAEGVEYVLIGGLAAVLHGSPHNTRDVDICPRRSAANLERLARALRVLDAHVRVEPGDVVVAFPRDADFLARVDTLNTSTRLGDVDISFQPSGTAGFEDLRRAAESMEVGEALVRVSALADVIRSKEAAGRPKDLLVLLTLRELLARKEP
jgi:transcriptional regulator with XRE-family HTH domain